MVDYRGTVERFRKYTDNETFDRIVDDGTLCRMWARCVQAYGSGIAVEFEGSALTYAQLDEEVAALRSALSEAGCKPGERVGVLCANSVDFIRAFLAAVTAGCVAVVLPPHLQAEAVMHCSRSFGLRGIICQDTLTDACLLARQSIPGLVFLTPDVKGTSAVPVYDARPEDACVVMFTGGTTGRSKGAMLSHGAVIQGTMNGCYGVREVFHQRYMLVLPLSHVFGLIRNMLASFYTGSTLYILKSAQDLFREIPKFRPTILILVPALAEMALALSKKLKRNMLGPDLRTIICGAAAVPSYLIEEYDRMGINLYPGYGLTESANLVSGNPEPLRKPNSVGIPYANQELRIVDGELWLRGRNMLMDYVGTEEVAWTEDHWFRTGDLAYLDEEGYLYITGRIKEIIVLDNAENISPAVLEARFNELPFVQDSQVFEAVNESGKHILALEVVLRATELGALGSDPNQKAAELLWEVNRRQRPIEQVSRITIRTTDFKRTPSMKVERYKGVQ